MTTARRTARRAPISGNATGMVRAPHRRALWISLSFFLLAFALIVGGVAAAEGPAC